MLELGTAVKGKLMLMPRAVLTESVPGKVYHVRIETEGIPDEEGCARLLVERLYERFRAKVVWIRVESGIIDLQLLGSPFGWAALIAFLPSILALVGIAVVLISVYAIFKAIPGWAWGVLAVGLFLAFFGPSIGGMFLPVEG